MATTQQPRTDFVKALSRLDATALVVGSMIGSGIFIVSADILRQVHAPGVLLLVWALSGVVTLMGALSYGELAAMFPRAGGQYVYLREGISPLFGYLYGWTLFLVIETVAIAAVAVAFACLTAEFFPVRAPSRFLRAPGLAGRGPRSGAVARDRHGDGGVVVLDGRLEQRRLRRLGVEGRQTGPADRHGGRYADRDGAVPARERELPERPSRGRNRPRAAGPGRHGGAAGDVRRRRTVLDGGRDHDLDVRLQQRPHSVGCAGLLRDGAGQLVLPLDRGTASRAQDPRRRARCAGGVDRPAVPLRDVQRAAELRHLRGAAVLHAHRHRAVPAAGEAAQRRAPGAGRRL